VKCVPRVVNQISLFMKSIFLGAALIAAIVSSPWIVYSQQYYVVIGAFATDKNTSEFKGYLPVQSKDTSMTENKNVLHLYVLKTPDQQTAIETTLMLKKEVEGLNSKTNTTGVPQTEQTLPESTGPAVTPELGLGDNSDFRTGSASGSELTANAGVVPPKARGKYFKFVIESPEGTPVAGQVHHVDAANGREVAAYNANTFVDLLQPGNSNRPMEVVCGVFGYKEIQKYIDYANPSLSDEEAFVDSRGIWVIPYTLEPLEKGDVSVMYNVSFYKDAVVMREPSKSDLDRLVSMMKNNPYYEIKIHAHCNGKGKREVIALGNNKNYFDVAGSMPLMATAKQLTSLRAEAVRSYLTDHGIAASRATIYSWGGSDMLVKETSPASNLNDRIEIEITRD
jgi:outer membrane protein OmpA-like peptidoglycan-associated protein